MKDKLVQWLCDIRITILYKSWQKSPRPTKSWKLRLIEFCIEILKPTISKREWDALRDFKRDIEEFKALTETDK